MICIFGPVGPFCKRFQSSIGLARESVRLLACDCDVVCAHMNFPSQFASGPIQHGLDDRICKAMNSSGLTRAVFDLHIALCRSGNNDDRRTEMKVQIRAKVWLEIRGEVALCHGKAALLSEIRKLGSIRQAARSLQMSYRRAWEYVREIEEGVRVPVVARQAGGVRGGGAVLTPDGEKLLTRYEETLEAITEAVGPHGVDTV